MFVLSGSLLWRAAACASPTACLLLVRDLPALLQSPAVKHSRDVPGCKLHRNLQFSLGRHAWERESTGGKQNPAFSSKQSAFKEIYNATQNAFPWSPALRGEGKADTEIPVVDQAEELIHTYRKYAAAPNSATLRCWALTHFLWCRITAGALELPASAHSCQGGRVGCTGSGLRYPHLPLHNTITNTVWEGK